MNEESLRQLSFVASILAAFAFAIAIQLIAMKDNRPIVSATLCVIVASAVLFLVATWVDSRLITTMGNYQQPYPREVTDKISDVRNWNSYVAAVATILFFAGIALCGWISSKLVGYFTTGFMIIAFVLLLIMFSKFP